ncbi:hypothetical protein ABZO31_32065 [Streptomyces sp. HUAS MG47]|uniref:hypothetical protein n=1 Tax=Streptomyces solicamelliae TaxID=3231716 RepID=UPI003877E73D
MSTHATVAPTGPTAAEHVRTVLARAVSLSLRTAGQDDDLIGMHSVGTDGRVTLRPRAGSPLTRQVAESPDGGLAALLELTDVAPTVVRDRVRARVTVSGRLTPTDGDELRLEAARVRLGTPAGSVDIGLEESPSPGP